MTASAVGDIFKLPPVVGAIVAASIEVVGFNINQHYLDAREFNDWLDRYEARNGAKTYKDTPENLTAARKAVWQYYAVTGSIIALTAIYRVVFDGADVITLLAVLFPVASALGTVTMNRRAALHRKRLRVDGKDKVEAQVQSQEMQSANLEDAELQSDKGEDAEHIASCEFCDWTGNGYASERAATNALTAHHRHCDAYQQEKAEDADDED